ncbi:sporulation membrane protein YtaF [Bacillus sp. AGMB 02131]|uniref:Sporulation membrane protein YtaF n=1 Tax=Peribacillus faecalis TaxID=2772559 RepID=A0A927CV20_9BACI|nr:sporulation membrane protein YtaF [Peribacillus faecalis]MBD3108347.1 sporulation membrane protein YtaF [Peribacillus faecalis]
MTNIMALMLLAFAVSLDSFSVGFTYGIRKMKIPLFSILIIACMSAITLLASMLIGELISNLLSPMVASRIGGIIIVGLGLWIVWQTLRSPDDQREEQQTSAVTEEKVIATIEMKYFGIAINILKKPMEADIDRSGTINGLEAILLGLALSLDAFGAGIGAAMLGFSPLILSVSIGIMSSLFLLMGMIFGNKLSFSKAVGKLTFLPGVLLIVIGILKW